MTSKEKMAMDLIGIDGTGEFQMLDGRRANEIMADEKKAKFNQQVDELTDKFAKHEEQLEKYAKDLANDLNGLEVMPLSNYVLVSPFESNPFQKVERVGNIITDLGGAAPTYKSNETGQIEEEELFIKCGTVIETGPKCEFVKAGDIVFYTKASQIPVPFYKFGWMTVNENRLIAVINEKLTERKNG